MEVINAALDSFVTVMQAKAYELLPTPSGLYRVGFGSTALFDPWKPFDHSDPF